MLQKGNRSRCANRVISCLRPLHLITVTSMDSATGCWKRVGNCAGFSIPTRLRSSLSEKLSRGEAAQSLTQVLEDPKVNLVAAAAVPSERGPLGIEGHESRQKLLYRQDPVYRIGTTGGGQVCRR